MDLWLSIVTHFYFVFGNSPFLFWIMCFVMIRTIGPVGLIIVDGLCCKSGKKKQRRKLTLSLHFSFLENILTKIANFKDQKPKDEPEQIQSELHFHVGREHLSSGVNLTWVARISKSYLVVPINKLWLEVGWKDSAGNGSNLAEHREQHV